MREKLDLELIGRSNDIIPDNEKPIVRDLLSDARKSVDQIDLEIAQIESALTILRQQRENAVSRMRRFQVALSSQKLLPPEIWATIFVLSHPGGSLSLNHGPRDTPWTYLQVCSRWRRIALSEYRLWNTILANTSAGVTEAWLNVLWSSNSTSFVSLTISGSHRSVDIYDIVSRYSARLRNLSVGGFDSLIFHFMENPLLAFKNLESVALRWLLPLPPDPSVALFSHAPSLRSIELTGVSPFPEMGLNFPWSQLTSLSFINASPSLKMVHLILDQSPRLVDFTLTIAEGPSILDMVSMEPFPEVILPDLRDLTFIMGTGGWLHGFIQHLNLPFLKNLSIRHQSSSRTLQGKHLFPQDLFIAMLEKSPMVERLHLGCDFTDLRLLSVLKKTPCLTTLLLHDKVVFNSAIFFNMMRSGEVLPDLGQLQCFTPSPYPVLELLQRQCSATGSLAQGYRGIHSMHITCYDFDDITRVRTRFQAVETRLRDVGKVIVMKEIMVDQRPSVLFEL